jgi:Flp pilus assembly protein TadG
MSRHAASRSRGSVLMLMPAGALIVLLLGAISFDLSLVFLRQRQASSLAADVANDLASIALDVPTFRESGVFELDPERADSLGPSLLDVSDLADDITAATITISGSDTVTVRVTLSVEYVFAKAIPGAADGTTVTASASAVATPG